MSACASVPRSPATIWSSRLSVAAVAPIVDFAGRFLRTILLSRLLAPTDFGVAVALSVVIGVAQMTSDIGLDRFVLLGEGREAARSLETAHALEFIRNGVVAILMILLAWPAARMFGVSAYAGLFVWTCSVPFVRSFAHLGAKQAQRNYDFVPDAVSSLAASVTALLVLLPAIWMFHDARAMLASLVSAEIAYVAVTHWVTTAKYRVALHSDVCRRAFRYGAPLVLNGVAIAIFAQADRLLVGATFGVETLGAYAVIVSIAIVAISPLYSICSNIAVSVMARNRHNAIRFSQSARAVSWGFGWFALSYASFVALGLDVIVPLVFGPRYVVPPTMQLLLSVIVFVRIMRGPPTVFLLVDEKTLRLALANIASGVGLLAALVFVHLIPDLSSVLLGTLTGELLSLGLLQSALFRYFSSRSEPSFMIFVSQIALACILWAVVTLGSNVLMSSRITVAAVCGIVSVWNLRRCVHASRLVLREQAS